MTYHFQLMRKSRIIISITIGLVIFDVVILPRIAFYSFLSWLVGIAFIIATVVFAAANANAYYENGIVWEFLFRRTFRATCNENGVRLDGEIPRYRRLVTTYADGREPKIASMRFEIPGVSGLYNWTDVAPKFAKAFNVPALTVTLDTDCIVFNSATPKPKKSAALDPNDISEQLRELAVGTKPEDGDAEYLLPLLGTHLLIGGKSGAGKGSWIWTILLAVAPLIRAGFVELYGVDPKCLELGLGKSLFKGYATDDEDIVDMLERCADRMKARGMQLQGKSRKVHISREHPFRIIVIDELVYVAKLMPDQKLRKRATQAIMAILVMGRATGDCMVAAIQDPRKSILDFRDLFPTKVALRLDKPMVDLLLGDGMWEAGAHCEDILRSEPGMGYATLEEDETPVKVQAYWQSDEKILAAGSM